MSKYVDLAQKILEAAGGEDNIAVVNHCATRLRLTLNKPSKETEERIKKVPGVMGLVVRGGEYQAVIGTDVTNVYNEFVKLGTFKKGGTVNEDGSKTVFGTIIDFISGTFVPVLPVLCAAGLVSAVLTICTTFFGLSTKSGTYTILATINNAGFYFLPIYIGFSAARKLGMNPIMGMYLAGILVHKNIDGVKGLNFAGIPITQATYNTSVLPIILGVLFMYWVDKFADKVSPKEIKFFSRPLITILLTTPVVLIVLGPLGIILGNYLASALTFVNIHLGWLSVGLMGALTPLLVMTGMNQALFPVVFASFAKFNYDAFVMPGMLAANVAVGAAALAVSIKSRNKDTKAMSLSAGLTGVLGITEPSIYGVLVIFRKPLIGAMLGGGISGLFAGIVHLKQYAIVSPGLAALPTFIPGNGESMSNFWMAIITIIISVVVSFTATWMLGFEDKEPKA
jgi:PTS system beta-glucosides-specific IIC component